MQGMAFRRRQCHLWRSPSEYLAAWALDGDDHLWAAGVQREASVLWRVGGLSRKVGRYGYEELAIFCVLPHDGSTLSNNAA